MRWLEEVRRFKPSTVSRRLSVVTCFYRTCVIDAVLDASMVRSLPRVSESLPLPDALSRLRRTNSHLALVTVDDRSVTAMVALEDLVEDLVGTVRDGTHRV